ncbi:hypothetical protein M0R88_08045 [Halorussus gelatinilyticus]|uniref:Uncharacterized protein n=1 Tax=Halorussus gelatinilyticus TaxID=2937524 RepID=A0A8U0IPF7_9EURY|nr:hypothetical protein [Halorussus gelatinilyticus]UPW02034.1 hypothetical protein M0R88_08045 [Halorussus gelatinilyticus]
MSAGRASADEGDRAAEADHAAEADGERDRYLVSPTATTKKRHRPDETGEKPACRAFLQQDDARWRKLGARQTVLYDDCSNCFPSDAGED